jgi:hypothetical protein
MKLACKWVINNCANFFIKKQKTKIVLINLSPLSIFQRKQCILNVLKETNFTSLSDITCHTKTLQSRQLIWQCLAVIIVSFVLWNICGIFVWYMPLSMYFILYNLEVFISHTKMSIQYAENTLYINALFFSFFFEEINAHLIYYKDT